MTDYRLYADNDDDPQGALCYQWGDEVRAGFINMLTLTGNTRDDSRSGVG